MTNNIETKAAELLLEAYKTGVTITPLREMLGIEDLALAYRVQQKTIDNWLANGRKIIGRKIGLTSLVVQKQLGVDQPDFGALTDVMQADDGATITWGKLIQPKIEAEIALVFNRDLDVLSDNPQDLLRAIEYASPALEIVDSRIKNWDIKITDTIADNASSAMFVVGKPLKDFVNFDFEGCQMEMRVNGEISSSGEGRACLGNPLNAALWLAKTMLEMGTPIKAGHVVLTGALGPMTTLKSGDKVSANISGLGNVQVNFS